MWRRGKGEKGNSLALDDRFELAADAGGIACEYSSPSSERRRNDDSLAKGEGKGSTQNARKPEWNKSHFLRIFRGTNMGR
jgi:hypothetical protein